MHDLMIMQVIKRSDQLSREVQVSLKRRRPEIFIEILESAGDVLHEDAGFLLEVIVLQIADDVLMVDFRQYGDLLLTLRLVLLAEMNLFDG